MFLIQFALNMEASSRFLNTELIDRHKDSLNKTNSPANKEDLFASITNNLIKNNTSIVSHYYVDPLIQEITEKTGGFVGDSLEMAKYGSKCDSKNLVVCGVKFMAETAKILSPEKNIFVPTLESTCSLDLGCPAPELKAFKDKHPDRVLVVYANTSAEVKAMSDWVVTSSIAKEIIEDLHLEGKKILWAPVPKEFFCLLGADLRLFPWLCSM